MNMSRKLLMLGSALCLTACVVAPGESVSSSSRFVNLTDWDDEVAKLMYDTTGQIAPYISLTEGYEYKIINVEDDPTFYLLSKGDGDLCSTYQRLVEFDGWDLYGIDSSAGYERYVYTVVDGETQVYLQFDYYPGGYNPKGFEIFMWSDIYVDPTINYDLISDWPADVKAGFMEKFGEEIPLAPLSNEFEYIWVEEDKNFIFTDKIGRADALTDYFDTVSHTKDWKFSYDFYNQGYIVFEKKAEHVENGVFHLNMRHSNKTGFIVDVWMTIELPPVMITEWTKEAKDAFKDLFNDEDAIPLAPISNEFVMEYAHIQDGYDIVDILDPHPIEDFYDQYIPVLEAAGFVENDYYYPRYGYHVFEMVCPEFPEYNMVVNFMVVDAGVSIQIYKEEVLGGTGFTDSFPVDQMKNWMDKYLIEYKEFPEFPSDVDGRYLYTTLGPEFTIEIYQEEDDASLEEVYKDMLEADGWVIDDSRHGDGSYWGYFARKEGYDFYVRFFSAVEGVFVFHAYPNSFDCTAGFTFGN